MPIVDYLFATPLEEEWRTSFPILKGMSSSTSSRVDVKTYYTWGFPLHLGRGKNAEYLMVGEPISRKTPGQEKTAATVTHALVNWKPRAMILLGIAGSLKDGVDLGDVIVPSETFGCTTGDAEAKGLSWRVETHQMEFRGVNLISEFDRDEKAVAEWQTECLAAADQLGISPERPPDLHIKPLASTNYVVKSTEFKKTLIDNVCDKLAAVEMEAAGTHCAIYRDANHVEMTSIRGISDYADENKSNLEASSKDAWRKYAAGNAARLLNYYLALKPFDPLSPTYELDLAWKSDLNRIRRATGNSLEYRGKGHQHLVFPRLISRREPSPKLCLEVTPRLPDGTVCREYRAGCVVGPNASIPSPKQHKGVTYFDVEPSEDGLDVELLLAFELPAATVEVSCKDEFGRIATRKLSLE